MKYIYCLIPAIMILMSSPSFATDMVAPDLEVVLTNQNPYPVEPGKNVNIEVQIKNNGLGNSLNTVVEIVSKNPFTLLPGEERIKTFGNIPSGDYVKISYNLHVDPDAVTNDYEIEFRLYKKGSTSYTIGKVSIRVEGTPELILDDVKLKDRAEPGGKIEIIVPIKNIGTGTARNLQVELISNYSEILPLLSKGFVYLGDLETGKMKIATLMIGIDNSAKNKIYTLLLKASYKDETNNLKSEYFSIGIPVEGSIILEIIKFKPNYKRGIVGIEIANKGTADAKALEAKLIINNKTIGIDYVSQLKESKKTTLEFPLVLKGLGQLIITYIGPGTEKNTVVKTIAFNFKSQQNSNGTIIIISIIFILVITYAAYKRFGKKSR